MLAFLFLVAFWIYKNHTSAYKDFVVWFFNSCQSEQYIHFPKLLNTKLSPTTREFTPSGYFYEITLISFLTKDKIKQSKFAWAPIINLTRTNINICVLFLMEKIQFTIIFTYRFFKFWIIISFNNQIRRPNTYNLIHIYLDKQFGFIQINLNICFPPKLHQLKYALHAGELHVCTKMVVYLCKTICMWYVLFKYFESIDPPCMSVCVCEVWSTYFISWNYF